MQTLKHKVCIYYANIVEKKKGLNDEPLYING